MCLVSMMGLMSGMAHGQKGMSRSTVTFDSHRGESFSVYMDGDLMNRLPQGRVVVGDVSDRTHEVVVVLKRPAQKAAVLQLLPGEPMVMVNVVYDERTEVLSLYTPMQNRAESRMVTIPKPAKVDVVVPAVTPEGVPVLLEVTPTATEDDVTAMIGRLRGQSFDSDRLALAKVIVASSNLTASQIARLAEVIDYSSSQVEFLKYAYSYCADRENYYTTVDILTFSSDKRKVLDYIATQQ